jgi:hypothetical protein
MLLSQLLILAILLVQVAAIPPSTDETLNPKEKEQLARATNVEQRIKVYEDASKRIHQTLHSMAAGGDFGKIPDTLKAWNSLLAGSLEDIAANLKTKKKSKALIHYEIQVRKAVTAAQDYKNNIPPDQVDTFNSCLAEVEKIRKRLVEIIFEQ